MSGRDISEVNREVLEREHKFPGTYLYRALCGVDTALWDIKGKRAKKSVCQLIGGSPISIPVYASSMQREISPEACLLYTSPSPRDRQKSRMPSSA